MSNETINEIRLEGEKLLRSLNNELYLNLSGLKKACNLDKIYRSHQAFSEPDLYMSLKDLTTNDKDEERSFKLLKSFTAGNFIESRTAKIKDKTYLSNMSNSIIVDKRVIPYRSSVPEIKNEPKRSKREEIISKFNEIAINLKPFILEIHDIIQRSSEEIGFKSYTHLCDELEGLKLNSLKQIAQTFLIDTEYIYRDLLRWFLLNRMELKIGNAKSQDLYYLFNNYELKANFIKTDLASLSKRFLDKMSLQIGENIFMDLERRTSKISESFCTPIEVPNKIILSIYPIGGVEDYESLLNELGKALSFRYSETDDYFEFKRLRENTYLEIFAQLFKNLIYQPKWLKKYLSVDVNSDFLEFLYLKHLMGIRRYCGEILYVSSIEEENIKPDSENLRELLKIAILANINEHEYLTDIQQLSHSVFSFRASLIEAGFRMYLRERFDEEWWREGRTGDLLINLWRRGGRIDSSEIANSFGKGDLDTAPLLKTFEEAFRI